MTIYRQKEMKNIYNKSKLKVMDEFLKYSYTVEKLLSNSGLNIVKIFKHAEYTPKDKTDKLFYKFKHEDRRGGAGACPDIHGIMVLEIVGHNIMLRFCWELSKV